MKIFKIWSLAVVLLMTVVACNENNGPTGGGNTGSFENIENEWKLVSVNGVEADFTVYISFNGGIFSMFQQVYSLDYVFFEGDYTVDGDILSGVYSDGTAWKCDYTGGVSKDGNTLTLVSKETNAITCVYEACVIPDDVREEATATRAAEVERFL